MIAAFLLFFFAVQIEPLPVEVLPDQTVSEGKLTLTPISFSDQSTVIKFIVNRSKLADPEQMIKISIGTCGATVRGGEIKDRSGNVISQSYITCDGGKGTARLVPLSIEVVGKAVDISAEVSSK